MNIKSIAAMLLLAVIAATAPAMAPAQVGPSFEGMIRESTGETFPLETWAMRSAVTRVAVSPDGEHIGIIRAQNIDGNYIIEIRPVDDLQAEPVYRGADHMEIEWFTWINDEMLFVVFSQEIEDANETYRTLSSAVVNAFGEADWAELRNRGSGGARSLGTRISQLSYVRLIDVLVNDPDEILVEYDANNNFILDVGRYNLNTRRITNVVRGNSRVNDDFIPDWDGEIRGGVGFDDGFTEVDFYVRAKGSDEWRLIHTVHPDDRDSFAILGFSKENPNEVYVRANRGNDKAGIYLMDIMSREFSSDCLFCPQSVDAGGVILSEKLDEVHGDLLGFTYTGEHEERYLIDDEEYALQQAVEGLFPDKYVEMTSRADDDSVIVVRTESGTDPGTIYLLKDKRELQYLVSTSTIEPEYLSPVRYVKFTARDGLEIPAYVTVPAGQPPFPAIAMPHGGPWVREVVTYDRWAQLLANRGYVVIQPQFRGTPGYGLEHWKAGDAKWGLEMQDDVDDAALYLVEQGLADPDRLAIYGFSYGGYSALVGSMREDNIYQCAISAASVGNLDAWRALIGTSRRLRIYQRPTVQGVNPIDHVDDVNVPLLVMHGEIDNIADVKHSRDFSHALERHDKDYKYVEIEGMDHGDRYFDHRMEFWSELLNWLETKCG